MILDRYIAENKSIDSAVALLDDLALECVVSLEVAHNDLMLECCQVEFQAVTEGHSVEAINEGIFDIIKKFFKAIWNMLKKIFGIKGSGGSGGSSGGGGSTNTKEQKKEADEVDKELERQKKEFDEMLEEENKRLEKAKKEAEELKKKADEVHKRLEKEKGDSEKLRQARLDVEAQIRAEIEDEINKIRDTKINDPFVTICPISTSFFNSLVDKMNELCEDMRTVPDMDQRKFESMQKIIEIKFLREICDAIDRTTQDMEDKVYSGNGNSRFLMDIDTATVSNVVSRYKELTAPRQDSLRHIITLHHSYSDFKKVIQGIKHSATEELNIDFQAQLDSLAKATMNDIKPDNAYTDANIGSLIARIKMRLITDLSQIIAVIGDENKKARLYQLNGIRSLLHAAKQLDAVTVKKVDINYIYSEMRKRGVEP